MPICPKCLAEYVPGTKRCEDCGVALVFGAPEPPHSQAGESESEGDVKVLCVRTFSGPKASLDARLAKNLLRTEGIEAILSGETSAELLLGLEVPLLVRQEDAERAARVLRDYFEAPGAVAGH